jgi:hypothetical protein
MKSKQKLISSGPVVVMILSVFLMSGCNRSALRIYGASGDFPETPTRYTAQVLSIWYRGFYPYRPTF